MSFSCKMEPQGRPLCRECPKAPFLLSSVSRAGGWSFSYLLWHSLTLLICRRCCIYISHSHPITTPPSLLPFLLRPPPLLRQCQPSPAPARPPTRHLQATLCLPGWVGPGQCVPRGAPPVTTAWDGKVLMLPHPVSCDQLHSLDCTGAGQAASGICPAWGKKPCHRWPCVTLSRSSFTGPLESGSPLSQGI